MKARCKRKELLAAFGMVSGVVPARSPKPILQNVKLVVDPELGTTLMATDLEVGIRHKVYGVTAYEPGSVILPTNKMQSILSTSADGTASTIIWSCTEGRFNWYYDFDETIMILEGSIVLESDGMAPKPAAAPIRPSSGSDRPSRLPWRMKSRRLTRPSTRPSMRWFSSGERLRRIRSRMR
jgi:hypothetical protein